MEDRDTKGDLYEYMLAKIATAGQNGQFRTPRHIIRLMVEMMAPEPDGRDLRSRPAAPAASSSPPANTCASTIPRCSATTKLRRALPRRHVPRLRLRQHHAAHRQHEHAAARRREPGHPLPRLARAGPRRRGGDVHAGAGQSAVRRRRSTTRPPPRTCSRSSRPRRPSCSSSRCSCGCSSPAGAPP